MVNTTDMKRSETKDLDDGTEDMPQMEPIHIKYFPLGKICLKNYPIIF